MHLAARAGAYGRGLTADRSSPLVRAYHDPVIFRDDRVFRILLSKESKYLPSSQIYLTNACVQPEMRKEVADWMLDVCEHQSERNHRQTCPPEVFCLAMNYMDRFLGICSNITGSQLQLLGAVCLMVAWKIREHEPLAAQRLIEYSDFTLTLDDIMDWEVLLLSKLEWDMSAVIAFDFVEHIIQRLARATALDNQRQQPTIDSLEGLRSHSETLITMCSGHHGFSSLSPCLIATACVLATLRRPGREDSRLDTSEADMSTSTSSLSSSMCSPSNTGMSSLPDFERMLELVVGITQLSKGSILDCMGKIEHMASKSLSRSRSQREDGLVQVSSPELTSTPMRGRARASRHRAMATEEQQTPTKAFDAAERRS